MILYEYYSLVLNPNLMRLLRILTILTLIYYRVLISQANLDLHDVEIERRYKIIR